METKIAQDAHASGPKPVESQEKPATTKKKSHPKFVPPGRQQGSEPARKSAATVLEVLAGERSPTEAAEALGVSIMRYYVLESRALQGLLHACEPRPRGPRVDPEKSIARLERQLDTLRRDTARYQALARAANRTVGVAPVKTNDRTKKGTRRRRTPAVRALKAAAAFRAAAGPVLAGSAPVQPAIAKPAVQVKGVV